MTEPRRVPSERIRAVNEAEPREDGDYVLYWMTSARRRRFNFGLQRASVVAHRLGKPLVVLEALRVGYRWASDRLHRFVMDGMRDNLAAFEGAAVLYYPYLEMRSGAGRGLLIELAKRACLVVTDDYPTFFLPRMLEAAGRRIDVRLEAVDSNGLLPMRVAPKTFSRAHDFRRFLHKQLPPHLEPEAWPTPDSLAEIELPKLSALPSDVLERWPSVDAATLADDATLAGLPIDHAVRLAPMAGGATAADERWARFRRSDLDGYADGRNHPDDEASSGLSPWLHFGHVSAHELFSDMARLEDWTPARLGKASGNVRVGGA